MENGSIAVLDTLTMRLVSRLPGDVGTVSTVLALIRDLPSTATALVSIQSAGHLSVLLNIALRRLPKGA